jgi:hypothetical protein
MNGLRIVRSHRHLAIAAPIHNGAHRKLAAGNPNHSWRWSVHIDLLRKRERRGEKGNHHPAANVLELISFHRRSE